MHSGMALLYSFLVVFGFGRPAAQHERRVSCEQEKEERVPPHKEFLEGKEKPTSLGFLVEGGNQVRLGFQV